jgi:hypothetical protein
LYRWRGRRVGQRVKTIEKLTSSKNQTKKHAIVNIATSTRCLLPSKGPSSHHWDEHYSHG